MPWHQLMLIINMEVLLLPDLSGQLKDCLAAWMFAHK